MHFSILYLLDTYYECMVTRCSSTKLPVGTFSCSCGFVYSRPGPDKNEIDKFSIGRIKNFGPVWHSTLKVLNEGTLSLRKKATILGVDPMTGVLGCIKRRQRRAAHR
jgi:hypothetical protein